MKLVSPWYTEPAGVVVRRDMNGKEVTGYQNEEEGNEFMSLTFDAPV